MDNCLFRMFIAVFQCFTALSHNQVVPGSSPGGPTNQSKPQDFYTVLWLSIMFYCYILFSKTLDRFYVGSTILSPETRLGRHLQKHYGKHKFTAKANDWKLFFSIVCSSEKQARDIEKHIKSMKSKVYIQNLIKYPEITRRLLKKFS